MSFPRTLPAASLAVLLALFMAWPLVAQTPPVGVGTPDDGFGVGGTSRPMINGLWASAKISRMLVQPDGKILLSGVSPSQDSPLMVRLNDDGSLDASFGVEGKATDLPVHAGNLRFMHLLADGRILVAGSYSSKTFVFRLNADGSVDGTFQKAEIPLSVYAKFLDFAVQSDGGCILLCDLGLSEQKVLYRFKNDGSLDTTFGQQDPFVKLYLDHLDEAQRLLVLADDRIVVGYSFAGGHFLMNPAQAIGFKAFQSNGSPDFTFKTDRQGIPGIDQSATAAESLQQMVLDHANNILALCSYKGDDGNLTVGRITPKGTNDPAWNGNGKVQIWLGAGFSPVSIQAQADGRVLVLAQSAAGDCKLVRFNWDGTLDSSFGQEGLLSVPLNTVGMELFSMVRSADHLVLAGNAPAVGTPTSSGPNTGVFPPGPVVTLLHAGELLPTPVVSLHSHSPDQHIVLTEALHLTAAATGPAGLIYTWYRNGMQVQRGTAPDYNLSQVWGVDEGIYVVEARYASGFARSPDITVNIDQKPQIFGRPEYSIFERAQLTVEFSVLGRKPMQVKWYKNDVEIHTESLVGNPVTLLNPAKASLLLPQVVKEDEGTYYIEVTNADGTVVGSKSRVMVGDNPSITLGDLPGGYVVEKGGSLSLEPWYNTTEPYTVQWYRNGKAIRGATDSDWVIDPASLDAAGVYTARIRTSLGNAVSPPMNVSVAETEGRLVRAVAGRKFSLKIPVKDLGITYQWYREDDLLEDGDGLTGSQSSVLMFDSVREDQAGLYYCLLTQGGTAVMAGTYTVEVVNARPVMTEVELPAGRVGLAYEAEVPLPENADKLEIRGLPAGLSYHPAQGRITGKPAKMGTFKVTLIASNLLGKTEPLQALLEVAPFLETRTGRFYGLLTGGESKGALDVTVTSTGAYTGKLSLTTLLGVQVTLPIRGTFRDQGAPNPEQPDRIPVHFENHEFNHARLRMANLEPSIELYLDEGNLKAVIVIGRNQEADVLHVTCSPCPWNTRSPLPETLLGSYNVAWARRSGQVPEGYGYGTVTVKANGAVTVVGKMVDNTGFTMVLPVYESLECQGYAPLYAGRGAVTADWQLDLSQQEPSVSDSMLSGTMNWSKHLEAKQKSKIRPYDFTGTMEVSPAAKYRQPNQSNLTGPLVMDLPLRENNVWVSFLGEGSSVMTLNGNQSLEITQGTESVAGLKSLRFQAAKGFFTGSGVLDTIEERYNAETDIVDEIVVKRPYTVQGVVISSPDFSAGHAAGFGLKPIVIQESAESNPLRLSEPAEVLILPNEGE